MIRYASDKGDKVTVESRTDEFKKHLMNLERAPSTIESYTAAVKAFFGKYEELNKENTKTESDIKEAQANLDKAEKKLAELTRKA